MNNFEYTPPKNTPISSKEILDDLKKVAFESDINILTQQLYIKKGKYDVRNISRRFGTWNKAVKEAGLKPGNIINYSNDELFENILNL
jgi:hypothetical protein